MRRPDKEGGKAAQTQRSKRRDVPKIARGRSSIATTKEMNTQLRRERDEALEQLAATSDVLKVISSSPGDLKPVFEAMLEKAVRICGAKFGILFLSEGNGFRTIAMHDVPRAFAEKREREPFICPPAGSPLGRVMRTKQVAHITDVTTEQGYAEDHRALMDLAELGGARTVVCVPMLNDNELVGAITIYNKEVRPYTDKQIELLNNFAAQAVIAIENTRLLNELRQRTGDLSEALEQQIATSEVLSIISSSAGELQPVFETMLAKATALCEASYGTMWLCEGNAFRAAAIHGAMPEAFLQLHRTGNLYRAGPGAPAYEAIINRQTCAVADLRETRGYREGSGLPVAAADMGGVRTMVAVPMFKENEPIGVISIYRREVRPFTDKQIELVSNFAKQAVIAIENTRLLNELRQRTDDLTEALEQQTATSEVLRVISSSPTNVQPVFDAIAESAVRLCDGQFSFVLRFDGKVMDFASCCGLSAEGLDVFHSILPMPASEETAGGRAVVRRAVVEIPDVEADPSYGAQGQGLAKAVNYRSIAAVPLLHEGNPIGAIAVARANAGFF